VELVSEIEASKPDAISLAATALYIKGNFT
jgi:hypothetical protein